MCVCVQVAVLKEVLRGGTWSNLNVEVSTIDSVQGKERDFIILSMVRSWDTAEGEDVWFIHEPTRLNVAITRSKHGLWVVCNAACLEQSLTEHEDGRSQEYCRQHMEWCRDNNYIRSVSEAFPEQDAARIAVKTCSETTGDEWLEYDFHAKPLEYTDKRVVNNSLKYASSDTPGMLSHNVKSFRALGTCTKWSVSEPEPMTVDKRLNEKGLAQTFRVLVRPDDHRTTFGVDGFRSS